MTKDEAKALQKDFIPVGQTGEPVDLSQVIFQPTKSHEVFRCVVPTGYDPQSGPIYCGDIADWIYRKNGKYVALCNRHYRQIP